MFVDSFSIVVNFDDLALYHFSISLGEAGIELRHWQEVKRNAIVK